MKTGFHEIKIGGIWAFCFNTASEASLLLLVILNASDLCEEHIGTPNHEAYWGEECYLFSM